MLAVDVYNTRLGAGLGLIEETRILLELWNDNMSVSELISLARESGQFSGVSARRSLNLISEGFSTRYLVDDGSPATLLKQILSEDLSVVFRQLCFVFTCRAHRILADFVTGVYWPGYRTIEKVITYSASQQNRLKDELAEYHVTTSIDSHFENLLRKMQMAMQEGGANEIGVWVSGFYGSGKSSFTKYLAMALDDTRKIDGEPVLKHLQNRLRGSQSKALLAAVAKSFPAAVVMLDLASEMLAGNAMEEVSNVLYYKVLQWAGYSRNLKVAALERRLKRDNRLDEFRKRIRKDLGVDWSEVQNDPLALDSVIPEMAHEFYPALFKTPSAFTTSVTEIITFENERVKEMIDIVREHSGKQYVIFVVDEMGQYVAPADSLILNVDGLAKNLKAIGDGKVWMIATAQQMLTEDDPKGTLNSQKLFKLKDRFPIQIDLESSDIREICSERLLGKSTAGKALLKQQFEQHGQKLRNCTKLQDAKYYDSDFSEKVFIDLYPFLPAHFDILLHLLGALAKSTGGVGLRSAIKVIQDILIQGPDGKTPVADQEIGWLANTVTLYDALEKDLRRAFTSVHAAVGKVAIAFHGSEIHQQVAKTVALLQVLGNIPVTVQNVAALMHPSIEANSCLDQVEAAVQDLFSRAQVPFGERDGNLCFFSEKLNDIEQERVGMPVVGIQAKRIQNEALKEVFSPLPSTRIDDTLPVATGLKVQSGSQTISIAGERNPIQTVAEFVAASDFENARTRLIEESRQRISRKTVFLLGKLDDRIESLVADIYRSQEIAQRYRGDVDQEVRDYCSGQADRAARQTEKLQKAIEKALIEGVLIFQADATAVETLHESDLKEACKAHLKTVAAKVFDRYKEAPCRADTELAEQFLKVGNLKAVTSRIDPMGLVKVSGGQPSIDTKVKALVSIRDFIERNGTVDGKRLTDEFTEAPFGWSQDTLRYLVAAMLVAGEIKLKVSGHDVTVSGQQALDALRTNQSFRKVGISLRDGRPSLETMARAAERLTDLYGEQVLPLEDVIAEAAARELPDFQYKLGPLGTRLASLGLAGAETADSLGREIADMLLTDASDAPARFGGESSSLYDGLKWATDVHAAFAGGLDVAIREYRKLAEDLRALPASGIPQKLQADLEDQLRIMDDKLSEPGFVKHAADLNTTLTHIRSQTRAAAESMQVAHLQLLKDTQSELHLVPEWKELTQEEQGNCLSALDDLRTEVTLDVAGIQRLVNSQFVISSKANDLKKHIQDLGARRRRDRQEEQREQARQDGKQKLERTVSMPASITSTEILTKAISDLLEVHEAAVGYGEIRVNIIVE